MDDKRRGIFKYGWLSFKKIIKVHVYIMLHGYELLKVVTFYCSVKLLNSGWCGTKTEQGYEWIVHWEPLLKNCTSCCWPI